MGEMGEGSQKAQAPSYRKETLRMKRSDGDCRKRCRVVYLKVVKRVAFKISDKENVFKCVR